MRIAIREQLTLLILLAALFGLAVVSIPTWLYVYRFVVGVAGDELALTASLKASRISSELEMLQQSCAAIATRVVIQRALSLFYSDGGDNGAWDDATADLLSALNSSRLTVSV